MIRILIADDHPILRRGLKDILVRGLEGAVCGEAGNAQQVLSEVQRQDWDLVILNVTMPGRSERTGGAGVNQGERYTTSLQRQRERIVGVPDYKHRGEISIQI